MFDLKINTLIVVIAMIILLFLILFQCFTVMKVKKHSVALRKIIDLNNKINWLDETENMTDSYVFTANSKREFENFNTDECTISNIMLNKESFFKKNDIINKQKKVYNDYIEEFDAIVNKYIGCDKIINSKISPILIKKELAMCMDIKVIRNYSYIITTTVTYTSPKGRNHYESQKSYHNNDIIVDIENLKKDIHVMEQIAICKKKEAKEKCDYCDSLIKNRAYKWIVNDHEVHLCPACNVIAEKNNRVSLKEKLQKDECEEVYFKDAVYKEFSITEVNTKKSSVDSYYGVSVTQFIKNTTQPRGGFLSKKNMVKHMVNDGNGIIEKENIFHTYVGLVVDYMTRYISGVDKFDAFSISLMGASIAREEEKADELIKSITGLNDISICAACKLVGYDMVFRSGMAFFKGVDLIVPDKKSILNISIMIKRSVDFFQENGGLIDSSMTFEGGYTEIITSGDADFLTSNTIWDMKVSMYEPTKNNTLQIIIYYILLNRSHKYKDLNIDAVGIFNPRRNESFTCKINDIEELSSIAALIGA